MKHQKNHNHHQNQNKEMAMSSCHSEEGAPGMGHGSASSYLKRFWIVTILLIPLVLTNEFLVELFGLPTLAIGKWVALSIATVIFGFALVFFQHALMEIRAKSYGMMTLVSIAVGAGFVFSVFATFLPALEMDFYLEISTLIWVLLFGHYLEAKSGSAAGNALQEVAKLLPKQAHLIQAGKEIDVDISELKEGDLVRVKPGEKIPADGIVIKGQGSVDEALISGESKPVNKKENEEVVAGSILLDSALEIRLNRVGENSTVGQIQTLIAEAQKTKPRSQKIADRASAWLVFIALAVAVLTILVWTLLAGQTFIFAITLAITVLVIACPHALGLAIPTVTTITTSLAVKNGFFIKNMAKIETIKKATWVIFDKTGTLTEGVFGVRDILSFGEKKETEILTIAGALEKSSSHIIGISILKEAQNKNLNLPVVENFKNIAGKGVAGEIGGEKYFVGNEALIKEIGLQIDLPEQVRGKTLALFANEKEVLGLIALADKIKPQSQEAISRLHSLGVKTAMLTGDNKEVAKAVADELGIDKYFAEVLPADKYRHIKKLQENGEIVLMVGDGVNDAPALTQADAGIAIGAGTDVAVEAGDVVLMDSDPLDIARLIILSRAVYTKMIQNLWWALGYNILAIPAAAGVFAFAGFYLRPEIGALLMSLSTVIVVINAMMLKKIKL